MRRACSIKDQKLAGISERTRVATAMMMSRDSRLVHPVSVPIHDPRIDLAEQL